jgi:uncharacterized surface protein with fasciclin (FAS1) repeats
MKNQFLGVLTLATGLFYGQNAGAQKGEVMVGGAAMYPSKNIIENAINSKGHTALIAAVKAAGLAETPASSGLYTVFPFVNSPFDTLPKGTVQTLLKPENKAALKTILTCHVVAGMFS